MKPHTIRFPPGIASALHQMAVRTGKSHSELVREIVSREVARTEGRCPACGQPAQSPEHEAQR